VAGLHVVDLDALLTLGRITKLSLGLKAVRLGKDAQNHLTVADRHWPFMQNTLARLATVQCVADRSPGRDKELDAALAALLGKLVAQDKLVGPGHRIARLVLTGWVHYQQAQP